MYDDHHCFNRFFMFYIFANRYWYASQIFVSFCCYCQWFWGFETIFDIPHQIFTPQSKQGFLSNYRCVCLFVTNEFPELKHNWNIDSSDLSINIPLMKKYFAGNLRPFQFVTGIQFFHSDTFGPQNDFYQFCFKRFNSITSINHIPEKLETDHGGKHKYGKSKQMRNELCKNWLKIRGKKRSLNNRIAQFRLLSNSNRLCSLNLKVIFVWSWCRLFIVYYWNHCSFILHIADWNRCFSF